MIIKNSTLAWIMREIEDVEGDFIELGVFRGDTFRRLCSYAEKTDRRAVAVDSFRGMPEPGPRDGPNYPRGKLNCGGLPWFEGMLDANKIDPKYYVLVQGWVPQVLEEFPWISDEGFSFALVDLDQYQSTFDALKWVWPRVRPGGVIVCDDYFPGATNYASGAITDFLGTFGDGLYKLRTDLRDTQLIIWRD